MMNKEKLMSEMQRDVYTMDEGECSLYYPKYMSQESFKFFITWLTMEVKKIQNNNNYEVDNTTLTINSNF
jgi:hypothetical protein